MVPAAEAKMIRGRPCPPVSGVGDDMDVVRILIKHLLSLTRDNKMRGASTAARRTLDLYAAEKQNSIQTDGVMSCAGESITWGGRNG